MKCPITISNSVPLDVRYCKLPIVARKVGRTVAIGTVAPTINGLWGPNCQTVRNLCLRGQTRHSTYPIGSLAGNKCVCGWVQNKRVRKCVSGVVCVSIQPHDRARFRLAYVGIDMENGDGTHCGTKGLPIAGSSRDLSRTAIISLCKRE